MPLTNEEPHVANTGKYPIGKAAELLGVTTKTLRTHTRNGVIKCGYGKNGRPFFFGAELKKYWRVMA